MATVTRTTTWVDGNTLTASALNGEFNNLLNALGIVNADISAGAAIVGSKLANPLTGVTFGGITMALGSDAQGDVYYNSGGGVIARLAPGTSGQALITGGPAANPSWGGVGGKSGYSETIVNASFVGSYVTICSVTIVLAASSTLHITAACDVRAAVGDSPIFQLLDGGTSLTTNGIFTGVGAASATQRYTNSISWAGTLAAGSHTINYQGKNNSSGNTITVGLGQISVIAIPG